MISPDVIKANIDEQVKEVFALEMIYGEENIKHNHDGHNLHVELYVPSKERPHAVLKVVVPPTYPSLAPPVAEVSAPYLSDDTIRWANRELRKLYRPGEKENILFTWVEWIKDQPEMQPPGKKPSEEENYQGIAGKYIDLGNMDYNAFKSLNISDKTGNPFPADKDGGIAEDMKGIKMHVRVRPDIMFRHGEPFTEKRSTFQAHLAPVNKAVDVKRFMDALLEDKKVQKATHNIMAYRICASNEVIIQDCDDDGESAAGARLLHLLQMTGAKNVLVVVSRWYGGVQLGPARFTYINNAARLLLTEHNYIAGKTAGGGRKGRVNGASR